MRMVAYALAMCRPADTRTLDDNSYAAPLVSLYNCAIIGSNVMCSGDACYIVGAIFIAYGNTICDCVPNSTGGNIAILSGSNVTLHRCNISGGSVKDLIKKVFCI